MFEREREIWKKIRPLNRTYYNISNWSSSIGRKIRFGQKLTRKRFLHRSTINHLLLASRGRIINPAPSFRKNRRQDRSTLPSRIRNYGTRRRRSWNESHRKPSGTLFPESSLLPVLRYFLLYNVLERRVDISS